VGREIRFSSKEAIHDFKLLQKISVYGHQIEEWAFNFGFVMPNSSNTWEQIIEAAEKEEMIPAEQLSGNMVIETFFYSNGEVIHNSRITVIYE
jgi:retinal rod rhodopsin-sensitive cGMP 3',5'-cyclic phosphodiesterase subunit delta